MALSSSGLFRKAQSQRIMTARLEPKTWMVAPDAAAVLDALEGAGAQVRFVGGCVRDALLGRPVSDIDIATDAVPEAVMRALEDADIKVVPTGLSHGTVTAVAGNHPFEITTLRRDEETDGRRAVVAFTDSWQEDAARRDFTINAMSLARDGRLYDPFGGEADLRQGHIRFVGEPEDRIKEDVLRILRFFRFHAHYGRGAFDPEALAACRALAPRLPRLSAERVWAELRKLLGAPDPAGVLRVMQESAVLPVVLSQATAIDRLARLVDVEGEAGAQWPSLVGADPVRRLAVLIDVDEEGAEAVAQRLKLSIADRDRVVDLARAWAGPADVTSDAAVRGELYRMGRDRFVDAVLAQWAVVGKAGPWGAALALAEGWEPPRFPLSGKDVTALGIAPGPEIGRALRAVEDWWVAADFQPDRTACLARLRDVVPS